MGHHTGLRERVTASSRSTEINMASGEDYVGLYSNRFGAPPPLTRTSSREDAATAMAAVQQQQQHRQHQQHHLNTATSNDAASQGGASIVAFVGGQFTVHGMSNRNDGAAVAAAPSYHDSVVGLSCKYNRDTATNLKEIGIGIDHHTQSLMRTNSMEAAAAVAMQQQQQQQQQQSSRGDHDQHQSAAAQMSLLRQRAAVATVGLSTNNAATTSTTIATTHLAAGSIACQDCGNQAKKDCAHMRCRTCCKTRGFDCPTHVKSTWVPAAKRRERQQAEMLGGGGGQLPSQFYNNRPPRSKRARTLSLVAAGEHPGFGAGVDAGAASLAGAGPNSQTSTSTGTPPRCSSDINSEGLYKGSLPAEYRTQAIFRCVKVTGIADGQDEYAYQTVVKIGGRIFKGILYDQGIDRAGFSPTNLAELQLGGRAAPSASTFMDLEGIYGNSGNPMLGGDLLPR